MSKEIDVYKRQALSFLNTCKLAHSRLTRWVLVLQEYNFEWEYIRGTENKVPDTLSRLDSENNRTGRDLKAVSYTHLDVYKRQSLHRASEHVRV